MVALSSSSSSASASSDDADSTTALPSLEEILADPQRHFPRFLFDSDPLAVLELLSSLLFRCSERGHPAVIECLCCWQDLTEAQHSLQPLLDELRTAQDARVMVAGLRLLVRLLQFAPDRVSRARLRNEMDELNLDQLVPSLCQRFRTRNRDELEEPLADWMRLRTEKTETNKSSSAEEEAASRDCHLATADTDSGTFSADEAEETKRDQPGEMRPNGEETADELAKLIRAFSEKQKPMLAELLREVVKLPETETAQTLHSFLTSLASPAPSPFALPHLDLAKSGQRQEKSASATLPLPPPPPPPMAPPPPPPPAMNGRKAAAATFQSANLDAGNCPAAATAIASRSGGGGPTATADIPRPLRPKALPDEGRRLRHLQWAKLPTVAVAGTSGGQQQPQQQNIWLRMEAVDRELRDRLDFTSLDALFGCPSTPVSRVDAAHPRRRSSMMPSSQQQHQQALDCVTLIGPRRSLSVNVFLKMCRDTSQLLADLAAGRAQQIGTDRLRTLAQLLPSEEEQKALRDFAGDKATLGQAEQFLLALSTQIPEHRLRLEAMLFRLDLEALKEEGTGLEPWLRGAQELMSSPALRKLLYILLHVGNYLNHGAGAGNAVGFRLSSLWKVEDVKAVSGRGRNLLHFVAQQAGNCADELVAQLAGVREAAKSSAEAARDDLRGLLERMRQLEAQMRERRLSQEDAFFCDFARFLQQSQSLLETAERQLAQLDSLRQQLAAFFCETERNFSLEDCFKVVNTFLGRFEKAVEENRQKEGTPKLEKPEQKMMPTTNVHQQNNGEKMEKLPVKIELKKEASDQPPSRRKSLAATLLEERERGSQQPREISHGVETTRRRTLAATASALDGKILPVILHKPHQNDMKEQQTGGMCALESMVDAALSQQQQKMGGHRVGVQKQQQLQQPTAPTSLKTQQPALIGISEAAKGRLSAVGNVALAKNGSGGRDVAKRINQFEGKTALKKPAALVASSPKTHCQQATPMRVPRLNGIRQVRSIQMSAIVDAKVETRMEASVREMSRAIMTKTLTAEKPSPLQRTKSNVQPSKGSTPQLASPSPLNRMASQHLTPKQQPTTPKGPRPKPTLTRQVSTASRPTLINTGSTEKKPKWI